jgi:protein-tyrosine phosphatase
MTRTSLSHPIRVDFLPPDALQLPGRLGLTFAPGKKQHGMTGHWDRDLDTDLARLRTVHGTDVLVSLIESHEFVALHIAELRERAPAHRIEMLWYPIADNSVPASITDLGKIVIRIVTALAAGRTVVIHCMGGLGRTGLVAAACLLATTSLSPREAMAIVRGARPGAIESLAQEQYVETFRRFLDDHGNPNGRDTS